ncbi:MAG: HEAT repeat domain-containing protein, partial [Chlamydiia bacterium]|nr:HEAT repeat domain-containing protein [Chlamydiia bacterium]
MRQIIIFLFFFSTLMASDVEVIQRIHSHLLIHDYHSALRECEASLQVYPESEGLKKIYVRTLAENGKDDEAILSWKQFELKQEDTDLLETLAWGVLTRLESSPQFVVNIAALMSAFYTNDIRAVQMLRNQLSSSNALLRAMAAQLSPQYRDVALIEELTRLLQQEKVWFVRLEVIKALGAMEVKEVKQPLKQLLSKTRTTAEEKGAAIASLVNIYEEVSGEELSQLIHSKRAGLRHLACQIISHLDLKEQASMITPLLKDPSSDVRMAALTTLYFMGMKTLDPSLVTQMIDLTEDPHPSVSLTASWAVASIVPETTLQVIRKWIYSTDEASRRLAAFVLGRIGAGGMHLAHQVLKITPDPFVRANLALGG